MIKGRLHSIETLGTLDGPGLRTVFFMQGCNMKCLYCHNRDSWSLNGGREFSLDELISTVISYREYYGEEGGVTFSGGEPLLQADFLIDVVKELKAMYIHTAIDTSGSLFNEKTRKLFGLADLIILDIKHARKNEYKSVCSYPGEMAFANLAFLQESNKKYWVRQVIVDGYTDDERQVEELKNLLQFGKTGRSDSPCNSDYPEKSVNKPERIELLPYHAMGKEKWLTCGMAYPLTGMEPPSTGRMRLLESIIQR
ncbi:MAG: 4Fe-4S cluster-binding domain-containing protein [Spirochaetales bacterium]|nr:4Fe-4S cluster-binding domain-containing protein [Spirochaetales bacterium]